MAETDRGEEVTAASRESASRLARLRHWAQTHLVLPAVLYFALMVSIWYVATHSEAWVARGQACTDAGMIDAAAFSPDMTTISIALETEVRIVNVRTGATVTRFPESRGGQLRFSPGGDRLAVSGGWDIKVYDLLADKPPLILKGHEDLARAAFSPDGKRILTATRDHKAWVWDADTGERLLTLQTSDDDLTGPCYGTSIYSTTGFVDADWSLDGSLMLTASEGSARVWDAATGRLVSVFKEHTGPVCTAAFHPDGRCVLTAGQDFRAFIWDSLTGEITCSMAEEDGLDVACVPGRYEAEFSPDGRHVLTTYCGAFARIRDARDGDMLATLRGEAGYMLGAHYSPDGRDMLTRELKTVGLWRRRRPEWWWGVFWLPSLWVTVAVAGAFAAALARDVRYVRRVRREGRRV